MNISKANKRDRKRQKKRYGHKVSNRSIFTIVNQQIKKSEDLKKEKSNE
jgi:ribosome assembly protein YihI (activator of Der GTPase)